MRAISTAAVCAAISSLAYAGIFDAAAFDNATIQPGGPRSGANGKRFFNVEGNNFGSFASFGVLDFRSTDLGIGAPIVDITSVKLKMHHAPAGFSASGNVNLWITEDVGADIQPGSSTLVFDPTSLPDGVGGQLAPLYAAGIGVYDATQPDEFLFEYTLALSGAAKTYLVNQVNASGNIRLIVSPAEDGVAATYSGFTDTLAAGGSAAPILEMDAQVVPEPATLAAIGLGLGLLARRKRRS